MLQFHQESSRATLRHPMIFRRQFLFTAIFAMSLLAGCNGLLSPKVQPSHEYVLAALPVASAPATPLDATAALVVFPAEMPEYLDRPQLVTRVQNNEIRLNEFQRWGEPVDDGFTRVLAQDLALLSGSNRVEVSPVPHVFAQEFEIYVKVTQFDGTPGGEVVLQVSWSATGLGGRPNYFKKTSTFTRRASASPDAYAGYLESLDGLEGDLAREIVQSLPLIRANRAAAAATAASTR
jgi:uncharacterized lipoprotein YmbA